MSTVDRWCGAILACGEGPLAVAARCEAVASRQVLLIPLGSAPDVSARHQFAHRRITLCGDPRVGLLKALTKRTGRRPAELVADQTVIRVAPGGATWSGNM